MYPSFLKTRGFRLRSDSSFLLVFIKRKLLLLTLCTTSILHRSHALKWVTVDWITAFRAPHGVSLFCFSKDDCIKLFISQKMTESSFHTVSVRACVCVVDCILHVDFVLLIAYSVKKKNSKNAIILVKLKSINHIKMLFYFYFHAFSFFFFHYFFLFWKFCLLTHLNANFAS